MQPDAIFFHHKVSFKGINCHSYTQSNPVQQLLTLQQISLQNVAIVYYLLANLIFAAEK